MAIQLIRKPGLALLACILCCITMQGQDMRTVFRKTPKELLLPIDSTKRLDLMDLYDAGRKAYIVNNLNDTSILEVFSPDFLFLRTGQSTMEIALLPMVNDSKIVCVINTVCAPACDSRIAFYTTNWKQLDTKLFFTPAHADSFIEVDTTSRTADAFRYINMSLMQFHIDIEKLTLTQTYNTPLYIGSTENKKADSNQKAEPRIFTWNQFQFK